MEADRSTGAWPWRRRSDGARCEAAPSSGGRFRSVSTLGDVNVGPELTLAAHLGLELVEERLMAAGSLQGFVATATGASSSGLWLAELRGRFFDDRRFQLAAGVGTGIGAAPGAADLLVVASLRFAPATARPMSGKGG